MPPVPERTPPDFVVVPVPSAGEERFIIIETQVMMSDFARSLAETSTTKERMAAIGQHFRTRALLSEEEVRAELVKWELPEVEVDEQIARARRTRQLTTDVDSRSFVFERITRIGYCNDDEQEVVRKTTRSGPGSQRVFVMRCRVCGHEYGAFGCDIHIRRCPKCQDGLPGLPAIDVSEQ